MIYRVRKQSRFVTVSSVPFNDSRLSWAARGVLAYLLSKPDNWECRNQDLMAQGDLGRDGIRTVLKQLKECGYMVRERVNDPVTGRFITVTTVYEEPSIWHPEPPGREPAPTGDGQTGDGQPAPLVNTDHTNKEGQGVVTQDNGEHTYLEGDQPSMNQLMNWLVAELADKRGGDMPDAETIRAVWELARYAHGSLRLPRPLKVYSQKDREYVVKRWYLPLYEVLTWVDFDMDRARDLLDNTIRSMTALVEAGKSTYMPRSPQMMRVNLEQQLAHESRAADLPASASVADASGAALRRAAFRRWFDATPDKRSEEWDNLPEPVKEFIRRHGSSTLRAMTPKDLGFALKNI